MNKSIVAIALSCASFATYSDQVKDAGEDIKVTVYGRITSNMLNDDTSNEIYFGRHEFAESTFGIKAQKKQGNLTFGAHLELGLNEGVSNLTQSGSNSRNRIQEFWMQGDFGKIRLGTGTSITYIVSDIDQSGTWWSDPMGMSARFGATRRGPTGQSQTPFVQAQTIFNERLRYDSPEIFAGGRFYAQLNEDGGNEFAFKYAANGFRLTAWTVDHGDANNDNDPQANVDGISTPGFFGAKDGLGALAGYKHSSGLNLTLVAANADQVNGGDRQYITGKLGYTKNKHAVSFSLGVYDSTDALGVDGPTHKRSTAAYNYSVNENLLVWLQFTNGNTDQQKNFNALAFGGKYVFKIDAF